MHRTETGCSPPITTGVWERIDCTILDVRWLISCSYTYFLDLCIEALTSTLTSEVVIHLCSCLLSVVSVLEVQNGNAQAWAAGELLDSGRGSTGRNAAQRESEREKERERETERV